MASLRAWIAGGPDRVDSAKAASPAGPLSGSPASFYARAPADAVVWPPTEQAYERIMRGLVPFVFVGRKHPGTGVVSGVVLVNAELREEGLWGKLEVSHVPGRALATVEVAGNVRKFREFPEVDVLAVCVHGVARGGGVLTEEASEAELLAISPAWKKYKKLPCSLVQEDAIALQMIFDRHAPFAGSPSAKAQFLEFFVGLLDSKPQDMIFVLKKPLAKPAVQFAE